jgi:maleamate amidohydrolase
MGTGGEASADAAVTAVGDCKEQAHEANLYDIDAKYGDVVSAEEVLGYLEEVGAAHAH